MVGAGEEGHGGAKPETEWRRDFVDFSRSREKPLLLLRLGKEERGLEVDRLLDSFSKRGFWPKTLLRLEDFPSRTFTVFPDLVLRAASLFLSFLGFAKRRVAGATSIPAKGYSLTS